MKAPARQPDNLSSNDLDLQKERRQNDAAIQAYKELLRTYLEKRPSGLRKKISDAIGTNRSFVSQITNPTYRVPIPSHYIHTIMDVCHLSPTESTTFFAAYLTAHPGQSELINNNNLDISKDDLFTINLSAVENLHNKALIKQSLKNLAETLISIALSNKQKD